jgi:type I restriction enzyme M protein
VAKKSTESRAQKKGPDRVKAKASADPSKQKEPDPVEKKRPNQGMDKTSADSVKKQRPVEPVEPSPVELVVPERPVEPVKEKGIEDRVKEAQRAELHRTIWRIANDLRGSVDWWDFNAYVLGLLFYRFISENLAAYINDQERRAGDLDFDYEVFSDVKAERGRAETVKEKGFFILPSELFANVRERARSDANLNETLARVFNNIEASAVGTQSESSLKGLFDDLDVNSPKLGPTVIRRNEKLAGLLEAIGDLNLGQVFQGHTIDAFGDAYEYLMTMYASSAGKSGGEFFTPQEVSELLARITVLGKTRINKVYDPACGSGSLLLKFAKLLGRDNVRRGFFGQEINLTTYNLARINMFLHDIGFDQFDIAHGDTLTDPQHWDDEPFEAIVSNPPYSIHWAGSDDPLLVDDERFSPAGVLAPKGKADLAFAMHCLSWLATNGTAAIVSFPGVMYRGGAEQKIRQYLVDNNFVQAVIQLPPDLFFGTTIATCVLVLRKSKTDASVLFIDASGEFTRQGNKNKLTDENIARVLAAYEARTPEVHFTALVSNDDLAANGYNLSVSSYVEAEDTRQAVDISALNAEIAHIVVRQAALREAIDAIVADLESDGHE